MSLSDYSILKDGEIIELIVAAKHNEEAALYLFYNRYRPKFRKLCFQLYENDYWLDDCIDSLYDSLKGPDLDWKRLKGFEGRCRFSTWIEKVAYNKFIEIRPKLIGKIKNAVSLDNDSSDRPKIQIPNPPEEDYDIRYRKVLLLEAISRLENEEQKFVILKTLQEYDSRQTAELFKLKWSASHFKKYNNKNEEVIPDAAYVDVLRQRAKKELKKLLDDLMKNK